MALPPPRSESFFLAKAPSSAAPAGLPMQCSQLASAPPRAAASRSRRRSTSPITVHKAAGRVQPNHGPAALTHAACPDQHNSELSFSFLGLKGARKTTI